jgi:hypothetical protein
MAFGAAPAASAYPVTTTQQANIASLAAHNLGKGDCSTNSLGGVGFETSCTNHEYWCADFMKWLWQHNGINVSYLTAAAQSFYTYGNSSHFDTFTKTPAVGDAAVFSNVKGNPSYIHHVAVVYNVSGASVHLISGDWGGTGSGSTFANSSHVVDNGWISSAAGTNLGGKYLIGFVAPISSVPPDCVQTGKCN